MSLLDQGSFKQEDDGFYTSHGYMNTPSSIGSKPMLDVQDIQKKSGSTGFSVKPEDLIYVSDWQAKGANPNLEKRNPSKLIDWDLFGIDKSLFGLEEKDVIAPVDTTTKDNIARAEGDILREGGDGGGNSDMGGPTGPTGKGDMTGIDGNFSVDQGSAHDMDMGRAHEAGKTAGKQSGLSGLASGIQSGNVGVAIGSGLLGGVVGYGRGALSSLGKQTVENISATNQAAQENSFGGYGGYSASEMNTAATESVEQATQNQQEIDALGGYPAGHFGGGSDNGGGGNDSGEGQGHGGGSSSDNDGGAGGGSGQSGGHGGDSGHGGGDGQDNDSGAGGGW